MMRQHAKQPEPTQNTQANSPPVAPGMIPFPSSVAKDGNMTATRCVESIIEAFLADRAFAGLRQPDEDSAESSAVSDFLKRRYGTAAKGDRAIRAAIGSPGEKDREKQNTNDTQASAETKSAEASSHRVRNIFKGSIPNYGFKLAQWFADQTGQSAFLLHTKKESSFAWRHLFDTIKLLGAHDESIRQRGHADSAPGIATQETDPPYKLSEGSLFEIFGALASQFDADCARAFVWDRRTNRPRQIWQKNLWFNEFAQVGSWTVPAVRRLLLDRRHRGPVIALQYSDESSKCEYRLDSVGSPCNRERIVASVAWLLTPASHLGGSGERIVLFFNYRASKWNGSDLTQARPQSAALRRDRPVISVDFDATKPNDGVTWSKEGRRNAQKHADEVAADMLLSCRYFNGWLERRVLDLDKSKNKSEIKDGAARSLVKYIIKMCADTRATRMLSVDVPTAKDLLKIGVDGNGRSLVFTAVEAVLPTQQNKNYSVKFTDRDGVFYTKDPRVLYPIEPQKCGMTSAEKSLSAMALYWHRPMLLELDGIAGSADASSSSAYTRRPSYNNSLFQLRMTSLNRDVNVLREAIAPVQYEDQFMGALVAHETRDSAVSRSDPGLSPKLVDVLQATAIAYATCLKHHGFLSTPKANRFFAAPLIECREIDMQTLLENYSRCVRVIGDFDYVFAVLYDAEKGFCTPQGGSYSALFFDKILPLGGVPLSESSRFEKLRAIVQAETDWILERSASFKLESDDVEYMRFIVQALSQSITPRRDGRSWSVFHDNLTQLTCLCSDIPKKSDMEKLTKEWVVHPFCPQPGMDPIGVVWMGRMQSITDGRTRQPLSVEDLDSAWFSDIKKLSHVVASLSLFSLEAYTSE